MTSLPALHNAADIRSITERVNALIRDYNGGRVEDLAQALLDIAALQDLNDGAATTFLTSNVTLNNTGTWFDGPNTGSIGAAGEKWLIGADSALADTAGVAAMGIRIYNGSAGIVGKFGHMDAASRTVGLSCLRVIVLAGATTFTSQARDVSSTSGLLLADEAGFGFSDNMTSITAVRLQ